MGEKAVTVTKMMGEEEPPYTEPPNKEVAMKEMYTDFNKLINHCDKMMQERVERRWSEITQKIMEAKVVVTMGDGGKKETDGS